MTKAGGRGPLSTDLPLRARRLWASSPVYPSSCVGTTGASRLLCDGQSQWYSILRKDMAPPAATHPIRRTRELVMGQRHLSGFKQQDGPRAM